MNRSRPVQVTGSVSVLTDQRAQALRSAAGHEANHDRLTKVFSRRCIEAKLERELARTWCDGTNGAILFLDVDQFKDINDSPGHRSGDELLVQLADLMGETLPEADGTGRLGGVDFLKIDGSFVRDLPSSPVDQHLVRTMAWVARGLGVRTIAEHVGDEETIRLLGEATIPCWHVPRTADEP